MLRNTSYTDKLSIDTLQIPSESDHVIPTKSLTKSNMSCNQISRVICCLPVDGAKLLRAHDTNNDGNDTAAMDDDLLLAHFVFVGASMNLHRRHLRLLICLLDETNKQFQKDPERRRDDPVESPVTRALKPLQFLFNEHTQGNEVHRIVKLISVSVLDNQMLWCPKQSSEEEEGDDDDDDNVEGDEYDEFPLIWDEVHPFSWDELEYSCSSSTCDNQRAEDMDVLDEDFGLYSYSPLQRLTSNYRVSRVTPNINSQLPPPVPPPRQAPPPPPPPPDGERGVAMYDAGEDQNDHIALRYKAQPDELSTDDWFDIGVQTQPQQKHNLRQRRRTETDNRKKLLDRSWVYPSAGTIHQTLLSQARQTNDDLFHPTHNGKEDYRTFIRVLDSSSSSSRNNPVAQYMSTSIWHQYTVFGWATLLGAALGGLLERCIVGQVSWFIIFSGGVLFGCTSAFTHSNSPYGEWTRAAGLACGLIVRRCLLIGRLEYALVPHLRAVIGIAPRQCFPYGTDNPWSYPPQDMDEDVEDLQPFHMTSCLVCLGLVGSLLSRSLASFLVPQLQLPGWIVALAGGVSLALLGTRRDALGDVCRVIGMRLQRTFVITGMVCDEVHLPHHTRVLTCHIKRLLLRLNSWERGKDDAAEMFGQGSTQRNLVALDSKMQDGRKEDTDKTL